MITNRGTKEFIDRGDLVVVVARTTGRGVESDVPVDHTVGVIWTFEGDKVIKGETFPSPAEALEAAGLSE